MRKLTEQERAYMNDAYSFEGKAWNLEDFTYGFQAALEMQDKRIAELEAQLAELLNGLKVGDKVTLKHNPELGAATIVSTISDVKGGVVLDRNLDHFRCWNIEDLEKVEK